MKRPSYQPLAALPVAAQSELLRDPELKARILAEAGVPGVDDGSMEMFAEIMVEQQTRRTAARYGFEDRGTITVGQRADLNVIDMDNLTVRRPAVHADLPGRLLRGAR